MVHVAMEAAQVLASTGVEAEVIDLRTLRPLDLETVVESVKKTGRAVIVEEFWKTGGFAGELVSSIQEEAFDFLDGPIGRIAGIEVPAPYSRELEAATIPDAKRVLQTIRDLYDM